MREEDDERGKRDGLAGMMGWRKMRNRASEGGG
jgi:hypothetical protein